MDWPALGELIKARREELRLPQDLTGVGGPSDFTVRRLERGEADAISRKTRTGLEAALRWPPGYVDHVLAGTTPPDAPRVDIAHELARIHDRLDAIEAHLRWRR